ncbi:helix-turn-helix domain-containing protein [Clostridium sp. YIM B02500]|uniref:helix-turn-helix domain-containing protein n=1 Tax=Clostridium sp. YIM B02500 TaxID=2910681 RepID=UPI001EEEBC49|nr:helix-turn-helix domain-containing protein [Clostridium sp. YIM B02500]
MVLRTTAGLQQLEEWLAEGNSLGKIARIIGIHTETMYRWRDKHTDIAVIVAPYAPIASETVADMSRPPACRIICAYDDRKTSILGTIYDEYETPEDLWNSEFMKEYFDFWGVDPSKYYPQYYEALKAKGVYHLSHYICIAYCEINAKGKIKPLAPTI